MTLRNLSLAMIGLILAWTTTLSRSTNDDKVTLARRFGAKSEVTYRITSAEFYSLAADKKQSIEVHGSHEITLSLAEAKDMKDAWTGALTAKKFFWSAKSPAMSDEWKSDAVMSWKDAAPIKISPTAVGAGGFAFDPNRPGTLEKDNDPRVGMPAAGMNWLYRTDRQIGLLFPAFGAEALAKDGRFDGEMLVGAVGEHDVRAFFANVLKSFDDKTATIVSSGKPKFVDSGRPAAKTPFTLNEEKSYWSHELTIDRATGLILKREGEVFLDLGAGAAKDAVTAKVWMKIEKVDAK